MRRNSIFMSEYEKKRRKRRKRIIIIAILIILVASASFLYFSGSFEKPGFKSMFAFDKKQSEDKSPDASNDNKNTGIKSSSDENKKLSEDNKQDDQSKTKYINISLSSGITVKAGYLEENGVKKFILVEGLSDGSTFDINKSGSEVLINDAQSQNIEVYNIDGTKKDVTKKNYVTRSGKTFEKDVILKQYPGYIWSLNARFIDDTHIAYISNLPWFKREGLDTYVWIVNVDSLSYTTVWNAKGKSVKFENVNDKGIIVDFDGDKKIVTIDGNVI